MKKKMVKKSITITEEQDRWLEENSINLSKFVRKCIEEKMEKGN